MDLPNYKNELELMEKELINLEKEYKSKSHTYQINSIEQWVYYDTQLTFNNITELIFNNYDKKDK